MTLPERTLCWVEGPPWDRTCEPVVDGDVVAVATKLEAANGALREIRERTDREYDDEMIEDVVDIVDRVLYPSVM